MRLLVLAIAFAALVAGCVSPANDAVVPDSSEPLPFVDPIVEEHDHASFEDHARWTPSMSLVGHTTMSEDGKPFSYIGEMDTHGDLTVVQILGRGSMPGFIVLDTSDPTDPTPLGRAEMPTSYVVDVKFSPDGKSVFAASQAGATRTRSHQQATGFDAVAANGFTKWDVSDPTAPVAVSGGLAEPSGCHMLSVKDIGGETTVFCVADTVLVFREAEGGAWTQVSAIGPGTTGAGLMQVASETVAAGTGAPNTLLLGATPHDVTIQEDPKEPGRWLALISYWDFGLRIFDVTDPLVPTEIGAWAGEGAEVYEGNIHGAMLTLLDGKRVAVVGPELLGQTTPAMWVIDAEDLSNLQIIREWVPPGAHTTQGLLLTVHQFQLVNGRVYLAYNHAGLWVLDLQLMVDGVALTDPSRPEVLGYYLPHERVELFNPDTSAVPNTWDVNVKNGYIFASDRYTGFYVLKYDGDPAGDETHTSFA